MFFQKLDLGFEKKENKTHMNFPAYDLFFFSALHKSSYIRIVTFEKIKT
jgi:hypothetical protein